MKLSKPAKAGLFAAGAVVLFLLFAGIAGIFLLRSEWLRENVRKTIVAELEKVTGGRVELGAFDFDWTGRTAEIRGLVIHGKEPAGGPPLLSISRVALQFKILSLLRQEFDLLALTVERPQARVILYPDGSTNLPEPKVKKSSTKSVPETILDLKIGSFVLTGGDAIAETAKGKKRASGFQTKAQNLAMHLAYDPGLLRYSGDLQLAPLHFESRETGPIDLKIQTQIAMERNRVLLPKAEVKSKLADVTFTNFELDNFSDPIITSDLGVRASLYEVGVLAKLTSHQSATVTLRGKGRFKSLEDYDVSGTVHSDGVDFSNGPRSFQVKQARIDSRFKIAPTQLDLEGLRIRVLGGTVSGRASIQKWNHFEVKGQVEAIDLRKTFATFTTYALPYNVSTAGDYEVQGSLSNLTDIRAGGTFRLAPAMDSAPASGVAKLQYDGAQGTVTFGESYITLPHSRLDVSGVLDHRLDVDAFSTDAVDFLPFLGMKSLPVALQKGSVTFVGGVQGNSSNPVIEGHAEAKNISYGGQVADSASADVKVDGTGVKVTSGALTHGAFVARVEGSLGWKDWKVDDHGRLEGKVQARQADLVRLLAMMKSSDVPLKGTLDVTASISGELANPRILADVRASQGSYSGEPFDTITAHVDSPTAARQTVLGLISAGARQAKLEVRYDHPADAILPGTLAFHVETNSVPLNQLETLRAQLQTLNADAILKADGTAVVSEDAKKETHVKFSKLDGDLQVSGMNLSGRKLGDLHVSAVTRNDVMTAKLTSNLAGAVVTGESTLRLAGDYEMQTHVTISKINLNTVWNLANPETAAGSFNFGGDAEASLSLAGPLTKSDQISGSLEISRFELRALPAAGTPRSMQTFVVKNAGTLRARLAKSVIRLDDVRFEAPNTNLAITGSAALKPSPMLDLRAQGKVDLKILEGFSSDLSSSGELTVNAAVRGGFDNPDFSGRAQVSGGDFHVADFSNGLTNANGSIVFNGSRATIQTLTAESGGGKMQATGFIAVLRGLLAFNLDARLDSVRVRYPEGVSTVADAHITVAGTSARSQATGRVSIRRMTINPKSEAGGILAKSVEPVRTPAASQGLLANLNLDIQVETAPDVALQTNLAQTLQAQANLRLSGTATSPALLGRVIVTEGEIVFFGNKYTITQGTVSFFNPVRIEPILNVDLETKARGVQIIITVSGPIDKPLNVTYRSDPPLQFSDIVALLATGRSPTDPSIALRDTSGNQSLQQLGASALLGQAIANPVSGRLQRFFGVSKLKIDPQLSGITGSPQARLTIEQQVTPDILFTYITDVSSTSTQLIRVEWAFDKTWSAILTREENGYVGLDFAYKKRFK